MGYIMDLRKELKNEKRALMMPAAGVFIFDKEGRVLLQKRTDNLKWGIPGGAMEPRETFEETATREAFEEINLKVKNLELFNIYSGMDLHYTYPNGHEVYIQTCIYKCYDYDGELKLDPVETKDARFFFINEIPEMDQINQPDRVVIKNLIKRTNRNTKNT